MKIYEIIAESQNLNEASLFVSALEKIGTERAFAWLSKLVAKSPKAKAIEELTQAMTEVGAKGGAKAIDRTAEEMRKAGVAEDIIQTASKQAKTATSKAVISQGLDAATKVMGQGWRALEVTLTAWGIAVPIKECAEGIADAYERNAAGDPEYQGAKLQGAVQIYLDRCVAQILTLWAGRKLVKIVASLPKGFLSTFYNGPILDKAYNGLTRAGQAAFTAWMVSPQGQKAFAEWIVGSSFSGSAMRGLSNWVGGWTKTGFDLIFNQAKNGERTQGTAPADDAEQTPAQINPADQPSKNSQLVFDPATGASLSSK
ncbi:hypothetical protein UFOVP181_341 [uncultured Caudovirales phage]|uniref:Uncharacterized protein n=1 Tax=uncultured Caudovirales phage TaxID=2100421 RepID=A0A6J7WLD1_9CAUD|nr:hypothetical protein UFOVP57_298 [uncultured Caudovirales phage]CAB5209160.1 hypothetical protein UFOVP181_341 [uncultured Caudovirales phage]